MMQLLALPLPPPLLLLLLLLLLRAPVTSLDPRDPFRATRSPSGWLGAIPGCRRQQP